MKTVVIFGSMVRVKPRYAPGAEPSRDVEKSEWEREAERESRFVEYLTVYRERGTLQQVP
jgi:hypothetical protein